jgi:hypothetical protein
MSEERGAGSPSEGGLEPERLLAEDGRPPYGRRLTDKILHAYTQAYAQGETRLATGLRRLLEEADARGRQRHPERRSLSAVRHADFWTAFCDARELYRQATAQPFPGVPPEAAGKARLEATLELMRIAYLRWRRAV